ARALADAVVAAGGAAGVSAVEVVGAGGDGGGGAGPPSRPSTRFFFSGISPTGFATNPFVFTGEVKTILGGISKEGKTLIPKAVVRDRDGSLRVFYEKLGIRFQTYEEWIVSGARVPAGGAAK